ncbi:hypothetical protein FrEUN1fDRAFT_3821 [Parafrankia sp. EUN1f]|nr:hypothetical protein FrEUN1fDRAFT_3821 [Parafrankia sp. EUN1f]
MTARRTATHQASPTHRAAARRVRRRQFKQARKPGLRPPGNPQKGRISVVGTTKILHSCDSPNEATVLRCPARILGSSTGGGRRFCYEAAWASRIARTAVRSSSVAA